ncbi:MAG: hypothetical protein KDD60_11020, partial [Bdellovibrionales bacterium]|nr:hypothetical protein [Bdellovibrionales bacterium]
MTKRHLGENPSYYRAYCVSAVLMLWCTIVMNPHITRADSVQEPPTVLGFLEEATLFPGGFRIHAKLDTGA